LIADDLVDIYGTKFWDRLSAEQRVELNRYVTRWRLSTLMHGEHGAMLVCSQLVENVHGQDAKLFQATQVVDEGRHNEVLHRYLALRLEGESYPLAGNVKEIFDTLLGTSAWYLKTIGLQLVAETFAVSLFRMLAESSKDEVLRVICRRILQDEARHMGFSMLSLPAVVEEATESERHEMEDFAVWALNRTLRGIFPLAAYEDIGFDRSEIEEIRQLRRQRAAGGDETAFRKFFRRDLHAGLVRNMRKVGVLTARVTPDLEALGHLARRGLTIRVKILEGAGSQYRGALPKKCSQSLMTEPRWLPLCAAIEFDRHVVDKHGKHTGIRDIAML